MVRKMLKYKAKGNNILEDLIEIQIDQADGSIVNIVLPRALADLL